VHVYSTTLDLSPLLLAAMQQTRLHAALVYCADEAAKVSSIWALFTLNPDLLRTPGVRRVTQPLDHGQRPVLWTDDHTDITRLLYH